MRIESRVIEYNNLVLCSPQKIRRATAALRSRIRDKVITHNSTFTNISKLVIIVFRLYLYYFSITGFTDSKTFWPCTFLILTSVLQITTQIVDPFSLKNLIALLSSSVGVTPGSTLDLYVSQCSYLFPSLSFFSVSFGCIKHLKPVSTLKIFVRSSSL